VYVIPTVFRSELGFQKHELVPIPEGVHGISLMRIQKSSFLIALVLLLADQSAAQERLGLEQGLRISQYARDVWQFEDGLPQNSVNAMAQTPDGYLWLGTQEGLARFDGVSFTVFGPDTEPSFATSDIIQLTTSQDGTLWIVVRRGGVLTYQGGVFSRISGVPESATSVRVDDDGTAWIGTFGAGLTRVSAGVATTFGAEAGFEGRFIGTTLPRGDGIRWLGTDTGLMMFDGERFLPADVQDLEDAHVSSLFQENDGTLWVGTRDERLFRITSTEVFERTDLLIPGGGYVAAMVRDAAGSLWFGQSAGGVSRVSHAGTDRFGVAHGLTDNQVLSLFEDDDGSLWIGTDGGGVNRIRRGLFTPFSAAEGLAHDNVFTVLTGRNGWTWIGTEDGLVALENNRIVETLGTAEGIANPHVYALAEDAAGGLWIGTAGGGVYHRASDGALSHYSSADGLGSDVIFALLEDSNGVVWIGTDAGVNTITNGVIESLSTDEGLSSDFPTYFAEGDGGVWIATYDGGINHVVDGKVVRIITSEDGLADDGVLSLLADDDGYLWAGTYGAGLSLIRGDNIFTVNRAAGLHNNTVMSVVDDHDGRLWMSSNKGLFSVLRADVLALAEGAIEKIQSRVYSKEDGLLTPEASGGQQPSAWLSAKGEIWFPTVKGVAMVRTSDLSFERKAPQTLIESIKVDGVVYDHRQELALPAGSDRVEIEYTATALIKPHDVRFAFKIEGHDSKWIDNGARRQANYTNLSPGEYTLQVASSSASGAWESRPVSLRFSLAPHFWETEWFALVLLFLIAGGLFGVYKARIGAVRRKAEELERVVDERTHELRLEKEVTEEAKNVIEAQAVKLQELDRLKTRFFANVSHEFRTPLTMIIGPLENALAGRHGQIVGRVRGQMELMLRNALRLMRLINQLMDLSKLEAGKMELRAGSRNIVAFLKDVMFTISPFAEKKGLELIVESSDPDVQVYYEPDKLEKVFYNLLSNASKFTPTGGKLSIDISTRAADETYAGGSVLIGVSDTGRGIPADALPHIFDRFHQVDGSNTRQHEGTGIGLSLVEELVTLHGGTVQVESEVGVGTTFSIVFPLGRSHLEDDQVVMSETAEYFAPELSNIASSEFETGEELGSESSEPAEAPSDAPRILVVDDNSDVRDYVGSILSETYQISFATDGLDGLEKVRAEMPDLILSDVMMPRMDGNEFVRALKSDPGLKIIPVILVSARATQEVKVEGLQMGADDYVPKPFNAKELLARIANLLKLREHQVLLKEMNEHLEDRVEQQLNVILTERERYEAELIEERDRAQASSRMKSAILDNMNHEFRTPLSIILGSSELLAEEVPDHLQEFLQNIQHGAGRLHSTLEAVCEISAVTAGVRAHIDDLDLTGAVRHVVDRQRKGAERKGLALHLRTPPDRRLVVRSEESGYLRILTIVLKNAIKFTDAGTVTVDVVETASDVITHVRDTGPGIPEDRLEKIFEAFVQGSEGLQRAHEGTGLGLAIARGRAEAMGAVLTVKSVVGEGSVFSLAVPRVSDRTAARRIEGLGDQESA
jgi:signal transduction histidine kinase/ligand-binding sensor domain-containing protein